MFLLYGAVHVTPANSCCVLCCSQIRYAASVQNATGVVLIEAMRHVGLPSLEFLQCVRWEPWGWGHIHAHPDGVGHPLSLLDLAWLGPSASISPRTQLRVHATIMYVHAPVRIHLQVCSKVRGQADRQAPRPRFS